VDTDTDDIYGSQRCLRVLDVEREPEGQGRHQGAIVPDQVAERFERAMAGRWYLRTQVTRFGRPVPWFILRLITCGCEEVEARGAPFRRGREG
jgi:hypothetical protein